MKKLPLIVALFPLLLALSGDTAALQEQPQAQRTDRWTEDTSSQLIFFAVIEGL